MLGVLAFKQSLFAGVLDGGAGEVLMNGTRLAKFMQSVGEVTGAMGVAEEAASAPVQPAAPPVAHTAQTAQTAQAAEAAGVDASAPDEVPPQGQHQPAVCLLYTSRCV